ncbi:MAG: hypothetical protein JW772_01350 [Candidatus Diapherotrites archaeon]|nr:hypothetical protein [Candidatus Diapherotrites archaeon]
MNLKISAILFLFVLTFSTANAEILVGLSPKDPAKDVLVLYPEETGVLKLSVKNSGAATEEVFFRITGTHSIGFINQGYVQEQVARQIVLKPNEERFFEIEAKAVSPGPEEQTVTVYSGLEEYTQATSALVRIAEPSIEIETTNPVITKNFGSFTAKAANKSSEAIQNLEFDVIPQAGLDYTQGEFRMDFLAAGESIEKEFEFYIDYRVWEEKSLFLQASFNDSNGFHIMHRQIPVQVPVQTDFVSAAIILLIVLVIAVIILETTGKRKNKAK